jgi:4-hydroxy-tetrahydrodipicolinate reductase
MIQVVISGAGGKLATAIADAVVAADDLELTGLFNPRRAGQTMYGKTVSGDHDAMTGDVVVETAHNDVVLDNLSQWQSNGLAAVVGTSGFTPERLAQLRESWGSNGPACLVVPNFAIGAVLMMRFAAQAAPYFEFVEIVERHSSTKPDAPSGTSLATAIGVSAAGGRSAEGSEELVDGARGALVEGVRVHAMRLPGLISQQEVALSNTGEVLSIEHLSTEYGAFAAGALLAIRKVRNLESGVHLGLDTVL